VRKFAMIPLVKNIYKYLKKTFFNADVKTKISKKSLLYNLNYLKKI